MSIAILAIMLYFFAFTWVTLPPLTLFLGWQIETQLSVLPLVEEEYSEYVQPGDLVVSINGRPVQRGEIVFVAPISDIYEFKVQRGEDRFTQSIPVGSSRLFKLWQVSIGIISLAFWFIGLMTVAFARDDQFSPMFVGFGFQLIAAGILSPGPTQLGAPGAWIIGRVLIFYFPLIMMYLGFLPRYGPLPSAIKKFLRNTFYFLSGWAFTAAIETLFLFPNASLTDFIGFSIATVLTILAGVGIVATFIVLVVRFIRADKQSYERRQLSILLTFLALALIPLFIFVIMPLSQTVFIPYPFIYSLLLLAPAGYFFVLHRQGHLGLDPFFSRVVTVIILVLAVGMAFSTAMYFMNTLFKVSFDAAWQGAFLVILFGIAISGQKQVQSTVDLLLYGHDDLNQDAIQIAKAKLSANPEPVTVTEVANQIAAYLNLQYVAVLAQDSCGYTMLAGNVSSLNIPKSPLFHSLLLRAKRKGALIALPEWVELSMPIKARGEMIGILLLSRPVGGYFNARQVEMLKDVTDILAFSLLVISLVGTMQELSQQALYEKEMQRRKIATEIHNEPLHALTTLMMRMQTKATDEAFRETAQTIRQVTRDLRRIISDLRPPVLKESLEWITRQTVREFEETHYTTTVSLYIELHCDGQVSEQIKSAFYYILTESLNNISKHAQAKNVAVLFLYNTESITLEVKDDGVGARVAEQSLTELLREHHVGLADMYRWASIAGGRLDIETNKPSGLTVKLILPREKRESSWNTI